MLFGDIVKNFFQKNVPILERDNGRFITINGCPYPINSIDIKMDCGETAFRVDMPCCQKDYKTISEFAFSGESPCCTINIIYRNKVAHTLLDAQIVSVRWLEGRATLRIFCSKNNHILCQ